MHLFLYLSKSAIGCQKPNKRVVCYHENAKWTLYTLYWLFLQLLI